MRIVRETKVTTISESTMNFENFLELCSRLCDRNFYKWGRPNPKMGNLSFVDFDGWQKWVDEGYKGQLSIRCEYSYHLIETMEGKKRSIEILGDSYELASRRRRFLEEFNFHVVK